MKPSKEQIKKAMAIVEEEFGAAISGRLSSGEKVPIEDIQKAILEKRKDDEDGS